MLAPNKGLSCDTMGLQYSGPALLFSVVSETKIEGGARLRSLS